MCPEEKSQTFHNRQRVGDLMARTANAVIQLSNLVVPGFDVICASYVSLAAILVSVGVLDPQLLLTHLLFTASFLLAMRLYSRQLAPVSDSMREQFGELNAHHTLGPGLFQSPEKKTKGAHSC